MRLLLTRAAEDAARTREKLTAMGHSVLVSPVIEMIGTSASWPNGVVDAIVATSAQAFKAMIDGPSPEARRLLSLYLVGSRTAEAAREAGFTAAAIVEPNAAGLAAAIERHDHRVRRIVYLAGRDRKPDIERALESSGQTFDIVETYKAQAVDRLTAEAARVLGTRMIDGVLHFSRRSAALFLSATQKAGLDRDRPVHFCLSEDAATPLREAGYAAIEIAAAPTEADLLSLVGSGA